MHAWRSPSLMTLWSLFNYASHSLWFRLHRGNLLFWFLTFTTYALVACNRSHSLGVFSFFSNCFDHFSIFLIDLCQTCIIPTHRFALFSKCLNNLLFLRFRSLTYSQSFLLNRKRLEWDLTFLDLPLWILTLLLLLRPIFFILRVLDPWQIWIMTHFGLHLMLLYTLIHIAVIIFISIRIYGLMLNRRDLVRLDQLLWIIKLIWNVIHLIHIWHLYNIFIHHNLICLVGIIRRVQRIVNLWIDYRWFWHIYTTLRRNLRHDLCVIQAG